MSLESSRNPVLRVLRHKNYALFMAGLTPAATSSWMQRVGVGWLAWELEHSPTWLGVIAAADLVPLLVLSPLAGAVTDRIFPLNELRFTQWLQVLHAIALAAFMYVGAMTIEILFVLMFFLGVVQAFGTAARHAVVPSTVPREEMATAVALDTACFQATRFVGPAIASIVIPMFGVGGTFAVHACGMLAFSVMTQFMHMPPPDRSQSRSHNLFADMAEGISYVRAHGGIAPLFVMMIVASVCIRPLQDMLPGFAGAVFGSGAVGLAWLTSAMGVGAMISAVWVAMHGRVNGLTRMSFIGFCGLGFATLGFVASDRLWIGVLFAALTGYTLNTLTTCVQAMVQTSIDNRMRGRVMSLYTLILRGTPAFGALSFGLLAEWVGLRWTFTLAAAVCLAGAGVLLPKRHAIAQAIELRPVSPPPGAA
jgi:MFS family permease